MGIIMEQIQKAKPLLAKLGYQHPLHKIELEVIDKKFQASYAPCNFLRDVISSGRTENLVKIFSTFNDIASLETHPFNEFVSRYNVNGPIESNEIINQYEQWFEANKNEFSEWI